MLKVSIMSMSAMNTGSIPDVVLHFQPNNTDI